MTGGPFVSLQPGVSFGRPMLNNTRLRVEGVAELARTEGVSLTVDAYKNAYGDYASGIDRAAVLVACWYMALYGTRRWRDWWGDWADDHVTAFWSAKWDEIPDPPVQGKP